MIYVLKRGIDDNKKYYLYGEFEERQYAIDFIKQNDFPINKFRIVEGKDLILNLLLSEVQNDK